MTAISLTPEETRKWMPYILIVMMIFIIAGLSWMWNNERNARITLQNAASTVRTIDGIEQPGQAAAKNREALNDSIDKQMEEGNTRLQALYKVEKNIRDRRDNYVSKKDDLTSLGNQLAAMGIANTVILGDSTAKASTGDSSFIRSSPKTN